MTDLGVSDCCKEEVVGLDKGKETSTEQVPYDCTAAVDRLYEKLDQHKDGKSNKLVLPKPEVTVANKKSIVSNFRAICAKLNRTEQEVAKFMEQELSTKVSIDGNGGLKLEGSFRLPRIQSNLASYIETFMRCKECNGYVTEVVKENRITYINCKGCLAKKAIPA